MSADRTLLSRRDLLAHSAGMAVLGLSTSAVATSVTQTEVSATQPAPDASSLSAYAFAAAGLAGPTPSVMSLLT